MKSVHFSDLCNLLLLRLLQHKDRDDQPDWSALPSELLCEILRHLTLVDHLRFSAVCKSWQSVVQKRQIRPALEPPWLLLPNRRFPERVNFLSLAASKKRYSFTLPSDDFSAENLIGSSSGWLITNTVDGEVFISNPITRIEIQLPSITTFPDVKLSYFDSQGTKTSDPESLSDLVIFDPALHGGEPTYSPEVMLLSRLSTKYFMKAIFIPACSPRSPTLLCGYNVVAIILNFRLAVFRSGDSKWTIVKPPEYRAFQDINFIDEVVYAVDRLGKLFTLDIFTATLQEFSVELPWTSSNNTTLNLVALARDLLLVNWESYYSIATRKHVTEKVTIYKLDSCSKTWAKTDTLGQYCLFIGRNKALSFSTIDFPELKPNCIYFTDTSPSICSCHRERLRNMGVFDFDQKIMKPIDGYFDFLKYPAPLWFSPSLFYVG